MVDYKLTRFEATMTAPAIAPDLVNQRSKHLANAGLPRGRQNDVSTTRPRVDLPLGLVADRVGGR
jgi:hypothetical protein